MTRFLGVIIFLLFIQSGFAQNRIRINYITDTQVSINLNNESELSTRFTVSENGFASKVRILNENDWTGDLTVKVIQNSGIKNTLVAGPYNWRLKKTMQGWIEFDFPSAIPVFKDFTYILSISKRAQQNSSENSSISINSYPDTKNPKVPAVTKPFSNLVKSGRFNFIVLIVAYPKLTAGSIGRSQSIGFNTQPDPLTQHSPPSGGTGIYVYQWQSSKDSVIWTNISNANQVSYSSPALTSNTWYRLNVSSGNFIPVASNPVLIKVYPKLVACTIGNRQTICYNIKPASLIQVSTPSGGTGSYIYQWQSSKDSIKWNDINGASLDTYSPPALTENTWYRLDIRSGYSVKSNTVKITLLKQINEAQLYDTKTIFDNTSTTFNVIVSGGTPPYTITYSVNGVVQPTITNYISGTNLPTGNLAAGTYTYSLVSVKDINGCDAQSLGKNITVTVLPNQVSLTNKALILVNSSSSSYTDYVDYIKPYLDNFGIPYDVCNVNTTSFPSFDGYAIIVFGHKNVYTSEYPIAKLEKAVSGGVGLYSFDPHLFDYASGFNTPVPQKSVTSNQINISNTTHFITQYHAPDIYNPTNNQVPLLKSWTLAQNSNLTGGTDLAVISSGGESVSLLQVTNYGKGKIVKWCGYDWVFESTLGPVFGMDDLLWRGIVWAARKPFAMQGMPPFITMRVDDVTGGGPGATDSFEWIKICNEYGLIPWCGTYNNFIYKIYIPTLKSLIDNNLATASPHAFFWNDFIYFNHDNITNPPFDPAARTRSARDYYIQNGLKISKYFVPHYYEVSSAALPEISAMGGEFIGIHMLPDNPYYPTAWLNCAPYRINRSGQASNTLPVYYGGYVKLSGIEFFNCLTEIRDDGGYEWYPDNTVSTTVARGIRHLRRSLNSMVLSSLFTHERFFPPITSANFREIISQITSAISMYNPEYKSMDYAVQYIRARNNIRITNVKDNPTDIQISYSGSNDLDTRCYLFTESSDQISYRFVILPKINGNNQVTVLK